MTRRVLKVVSFLIVLGGPLRSQDLEDRFDRLTPTEIEPYVAEILRSARAAMERLLAQGGARTVSNTLRPYDDIKIQVNKARVVSLLQVVHGDPAVRSAAARALGLLEAFNDARRSDLRVYAMLASIDTTRADPEVRFWLGRELRQLRQDSALKNTKTKELVTSLRVELNQLEQRWGESFRTDTITVLFDRSDLDGLALSWLDAHAVANGAIQVRNEELRMVAAQATRAATRERAMLLELRARPRGVILDSLLRGRWDLARLLGERSWAHRQLATTMAGSPERVRSFLDQVAELSAPMLTRAVAAGVASTSAAHPIQLSDLQLRNAEGQEPGRAMTLRPYLPYSRVRDGLIGLAKEFMGLEFRPAPDLPVWEPTVEPYRVFEGDSLIGKVYLDVHWRPGRSTIGASMSNFRLGVRGRAITEVALIGGMVRAQGSGPATLGVRGMQTLFHEFGHLLHALLSVRPWFGSSGLPEEFDFREVPSTLFEKWAEDPAVVARFARHVQTGEPPPPELLELVRGTRAGPNIMGQWMSRISLELHANPPGDRQTVIRRVFADMLPAEIRNQILLPDTDIHPELAAPHIGNGYDAAYYTYLWSQAISLDLLSRFTNGLLDPEMIRKYRTTILEPGRSQPADQLITRFLGRPFSLEALAKAMVSPQ